MLSGSLFTREFLLEGVNDTPQWQAIDASRIEELRGRLHTIATVFRKNKSPNEADTEKDLIYPVLEAIGWSEYIVQPNLSKKGRKEVPDALLFLSSDAKAQAVAESERWRGFRFGACLVEAKKWDRPLDREQADEGTPSSQIINYLSRADVMTDGNLPWGILTNGRMWRLYYQKAKSRAEDFLEIDLARALNLPDLKGKLSDRTEDARITQDRVLGLFCLMFGREAFAPAEAGRDFHDLALEEGRKWEERVAEDLSAMIFEEVFPLLVAALPDRDAERPLSPTPAYLEEVREGALILLYRLLFVLFAEDRNLLPDEEGPYKDYSLTTLRLEIAGAIGTRTFSERATGYWARLKDVFEAINHGDNSLGSGLITRI